MTESDRNEVYDQIESFYRCLEIGYYSKQDQALMDLDGLMDEIKELWRKYEIIIDKFQHNYQYDGSPIYAINMPKFTRDQIRSTYFELQNLEKKIRKDGLNSMRKQLPDGRTKSSATKKIKGSTSSSRTQFPLFDN